MVVDNDSWVLPHAAALVEAASTAGDSCRLCRSYDEVPVGDVAFFLGCTGIAGANVLSRNRYNLLVHASDLPKGRGMSPWTWQVLEGATRLPVCLLYAAEAVDTGSIVYKEWHDLAGTELVDDLRNLIGRASVGLCLRFLAEPAPLAGEPQEVVGSRYRRRRPDDSRLDPAKTIAEQFDLLRVVDNERYPAFFVYRGRKYRLKIEAADGQ